MKLERREKEKEEKRRERGHHRPHVAFDMESCIPMFVCIAQTKFLIDKKCLVNRMKITSII